MKTNLFTKSLMTIALSAIVAGCSQDEALNGFENQVSENELKIVVNDLGFANDDTQSRVSEVGYTTTFTDGDAIGIYIIDENNAAVKRNLKATKSGETWTVNGLYYYEGADYIAYFPYDENMSGADIKSDADIVTYFDNKFTKDQSSVENYYACDLMTAKVEAENVVANGTVAFNFSHARGMMEFVIPTYLYKTSNDEGAYTYSAPLGLEIKIGEEVYNPRSMGDCVYRCIVKPSTADATLNFSGKFTDAKDNKPVNFSKTGIELAANSCKTYNVTYTGAPSTTPTVRPIEVGDYLYSDGSICPNNFEPTSTGCIGVIFSLAINGEKTLAGNYCKHGYVLSLHNAVGTATNLATIWDFKMWSEAPASLSGIGLTEIAYTDNQPVDGSLVSDKDGYKYTEIFKTQIKSDVTGKDYYFKQAIEYYGADGNATEKYASPDFTSGWFIPSVGQFMDLVKNLGGDSDYDGTNQNNGAYSNIKSALEKVAGQVDSDGGKSIFWTSNTSLDGSSMKGYVLELKSNKCQIWTAGPTSTYRIRPILAF